MMNTVTSQRFENTSEIDEVAFEAAVKKQTKANMRARDKANKRGNSKWLLWGYTDEQCEQLARSYLNNYRHQFRIMKQVNGLTR